MDDHQWKEIDVVQAKAYANKLEGSRLRLGIFTAIIEEHNAFHICLRCNSMMDRARWIPVRPCNTVLADDIMKS